MQETNKLSEQITQTESLSNQFKLAFQEISKNVLSYDSIGLFDINQIIEKCINKNGNLTIVKFLES